LQAGNSADNGPASELLVSGPNGTPVPVRIAGNVGIGASSAGASLTVDDPILGIFKVFAPGVADVAYDGGVDRLFVFEQTGGGSTAFMNTWVGIGTANPQKPLHVGGDFLLVEGQGHEQANLGGDGNGDVQVGSANATVQLVTLWNTNSN